MEKQSLAWWLLSSSLADLGLEYLLGSVSGVLGIHYWKSHSGRTFWGWKLGFVFVNGAQHYHYCLIL